MMRWQNVVIGGLLLAMAFGIHGAVDRARMNRDIRIMESVLGKLLAGEDRFDEEPNVSGMYFDGYGVLLSRGTSTERRSNEAWIPNIRVLGAG